MDFFTVHPSSVDTRAVDAAVNALEEGKIIVYPTDTLYALGCDALNQRAVERLCRLRGLNPAKNSLSIVCDGLSSAAEYVRIDNVAFAILKRYLPGPYTFILPATSSLPKAFKGRKTVGLRIPDNPVARAIASAIGRPVCSASALPLNPEGTALECAEAYPGEIAVALDAGLSAGIPSTVVDITDSRNPEVVRPGVAEFDF